MNPAVRQLLLSGAPNGVGTMVTVACGNSISAASKFSGASWSWTAEIHVANLLAASSLRFMPMTATTRCDAYGVYGYGGQTLDTINGDMAAQWIVPAKSAGINADLVVGLALLENDIAGGATAAQMIARVDAWIGQVRGAWPKAKVLICTPRPNTAYNTGAKVTAYQDITTYLLGLDDGRRIFISRMNGCEDGVTGLPLAGYTSDGTHPNAKGALVNARTIAATLARIGTKVQPFASLGTNRMLTGSGAASGTNVSGSWPTGCSFNGGSANGTYVSLADNPGWTITVNTPVAGANVDIGFINCPSTTASPFRVSAFAKLRIVSGATNLRSIELQPRINDGGGNTFRYYLFITGADADMDFVDGDVLTFVAPPVVANSGSITAVQNYLQAKMKNTTSSTTLQVVEAGFYQVQ